MKPKHKFLAYPISGASLIAIGNKLLTPHDFPSVFHPSVWIIFLGILLLFKALALFNEIYVGELEN